MVSVECGGKRFQTVYVTTTVVFWLLHSNQTRYTKKGLKDTCAGFDNTNKTTPERRWASRSQWLPYAARTACLVVRTFFRATEGTKNEDQVTPPGPTTCCHMLNKRPANPGYASYCSNFVTAKLGSLSPPTTCYHTLKKRQERYVACSYDTNNLFITRQTVTMLRFLLPSRASWQPTKPRSLLRSSNCTTAMLGVLLLERCLSHANCVTTEQVAPSSAPETCVSHAK